MPAPGLPIRKGTGLPRPDGSLRESKVLRQFSQPTETPTELGPTTRDGKEADSLYPLAYPSVPLFLHVSGVRARLYEDPVTAHLWPRLNAPGHELVDPEG